MTHFTMSIANKTPLNVQNAKFNNMYFNFKDYYLKHTHGRIFTFKMWTSFFFFIVALSASALNHLAIDKPKYEAAECYDCTYDEMPDTQYCLHPICEFLQDAILSKNFIFVYTGF
jgi:hypothetical protein